MAKHKKKSPSPPPYKPLNDAPDTNAHSAASTAADAPAAAGTVADTKDNKTATADTKTNGEANSNGNAKHSPPPPALFAHDGSVTVVAHAPANIKQSELETIIAAEITKLNKTLADKSRADFNNAARAPQGCKTWCRNIGGREIFIVISGAATVPLFCLTAKEYVEDKSLFLQIMIPPSVVILNTMESILSAFETWEGFKEINNSEQSGLIKFCKRLLAFVASIVPSIPTLSAAYLEAKTASLGWKLALAATPLYVIPQNCFAAFVVGGNLATAFHALKANCNTTGWDATHQLKMALVKSLFRSCNEIEADYKKHTEAKAIPGTTTLDQLESLARPGMGVAARPYTLGQNAVWTVGTICQIGVAAFAMVSLVGYECSTDQAAADIEKKPGDDWTLATVFTFPIAALAANFAWDAVGFAFDSLLRKWRGESINTPVALRLYPKTAVALGLFITLLACFSYGGSADLVIKYCPLRVQKLLLAFVYGGVPMFNGLAGFKLVNTFLTLYAKKFGCDDYKMAQSFVNAIRAIAEKILSLKPRAFAESVFKNTSANNSGTLQIFLSTITSSKLVASSRQELSEYQTPAQTPSETPAHTPKTKTGSNMKERLLPAPTAASDSTAAPARFNR